ncbi:acetyl-CoA C-acetyltransferase [Paenibacillus sp. NPDC058071]|uniref:acetyl-CoA C-acetyltransferase n=1 Tax=Paenibacillus sp. NPDC058071 TaxID=3346326 RepID=UPI0036D79908
MGATFIVGGARTAFGKLGGLWKDVAAIELGAAAIKGALNKAGIGVSRVDGVVMGMVLQGGAGQNPARQAAALAGADWSVPAETINKVCASGLRAITLADQMIRAGDAELLAAGGMESMSQAPFALPSARWGARMGNRTMIDLMVHDGLFCPFEHVQMSTHGETAAQRFGIGRAEQDEWALRSHERAVSAAAAGRFAEEIVTVAAATSGVVAQADEGPRPDTDAAKLSRLKPITGLNGTITAGNAPGVNDGAAAVIIMSGEAAKRGGYRPLAQIVSHATVGVAANRLAEAPALAIGELLRRTGLTVEQIDLFEVNEAFAAVMLTCGQLLAWDENKVNVNGGAIALGHPIGASGARLVVTLVEELRRRGGGLGIAALCSGGAQGDALLVRVEG